MEDSPLLLDLLQDVLGEINSITPIKDKYLLIVLFVPMILKV